MRMWSIELQPPETPISPVPHGLGPPKLGEYAPPTVSPAGADHEGAAPPSYEDTIAEDLAPVDGRRRDYSIPETAVSGGVAFEKQKSLEARVWRSDTLDSDLGDRPNP